MRVYVKCPCCGRTIFLVMEMELGSSFGKDYKQNPSQDWNCLNNFLICLQSSQGERVYLGVSEREEGKLPEEVKEMIMNWTERGYKKPEEKPQKGNNNQDWSNISSNFQGTEGQNWKARWIKAGFTYQQTKEWMDIGLNVVDFGLAAWLRDKKRVKADWVLNYGDLAKLKEEYEREQTYEI